MIKHYQQGNKHFCHSVAEVLVEEKDQAGLLGYITDYANIINLESYYVHFKQQYPAETLALFQELLNKYAADNLGRNHYEYIAQILTKMNNIEGGRVVVKAMVTLFRLQYKNRRAMMEVLDRVRM